MGHVDVAGVRYELPDGRVLLDDVAFRVGEGRREAWVDLGTIPAVGSRPGTRSPAGEGAVAAT